MAKGSALSKPLQLTAELEAVVGKGPMARSQVAAAPMAEQSVPLQAGENTYSVTVNMRWTISQ